jgi:capsid protein
VIANNTVGWGIVPKAIGGIPEKALRLWKAWADTTECDSEGRHTFAGIQALCMRSVSVDGEILIRRRYRRPTDDLTLPLQLQVLEADFLDHAKQSLDSQAGGPIIQGVEFDLLGRRAAYWLFEQHPGSGRSDESVPSHPR